MPQRSCPQKLLFQVCSSRAARPLFHLSGLSRPRSPAPRCFKGSCTHCCSPSTTIVIKVIQSLASNLKWSLDLQCLVAGTPPPPVRPVRVLGAQQHHLLPQVRGFTRAILFLRCYDSPIAMFLWQPRLCVQVLLFGGGDGDNTQRSGHPATWRPETLWPSWWEKKM